MRPFSLDFSIHDASERCAAVRDIVDSTEQHLSSSDLELLADYILRGRDEHFVSPIDERTILEPDRRYDDYKRRTAREVSYEAKLELAGPAAEEEISRPKVRYKVAKQEIVRPRYDLDGNLIDPGDSEIPGMTALWSTIDSLQTLVDMYKGRKPQSDQMLAHPLSSYEAYKLAHWLIDLRRHQYYLKDAYKPQVRFVGYTPPAPGRPALCAETNTGLWLEEAAWLRRKLHPKPYDLAQPPIESAPRDSAGQLYWKLSSNRIDDENPDHVRALLANYASLLKHCYDQPDSDARAVCWDVERAVEHAGLSDAEQLVLELMVAHKQASQVQRILADNEVALSLRQVQHLMRHVIPLKLARANQRLRVESEVARGERATLRCTKCGRELPKHPIFFYRSTDKRSGFCSQCKECQKAARRAAASPASPVLQQPTPEVKSIECKQE